ncbi:hypothetical protein G9A89_016909 [Geosiphon pyriformis]|nr:hypothetical protein G9A89_016909 [Geosiphon pyriformis]
MAYTPIVKIEKFTGKEDNMQVNTYNISTTIATTNLLISTHSNTTTNDCAQWKSEAENHSTKLKIEPYPRNLEIRYTQNLKDASLNNLETNQKLLTNNILLVMVTNNKLLTAIFPFKIKELLTTLLFSEATLNAKLIMTIYTNTKVNSQSIKLILDSSSTGSIITKATKTPIGKIDDFSFEVNGIIMPIKVLLKWSAHTCTSHVRLLLNESYTNTTYRIGRKREQTYLESLSSVMDQKQPQ